MKALEARQARTGRPIPALQRRPKLQQCDKRFLTAFTVLGKARQFGMSAPQALALSEIKAYLEISGVDHARWPRYVDVLQQMDAVYLEHAAQKADEARKAAKS